MIKAVIIDDEAEGRNVVNNIVKNYCTEVEIAGEAATVASGVKLIQKTNPDLVFLDVQMPDGTGFNLLEQFDEIAFQVVFVTAYEQYAIRAFKYSAIDYILKPIDPQLLIEAVEKAGKLSPGKNQSSERVSNLLENSKSISKIALPTLNGYRFVKVQDIVRCKSNNNYTLFYLQTNEQFIVTRTLKDYEELLKNESFIRVHQSHLINLNYVEQYIKGEGGTAIMSDGSEIEVSRRKKDLFLKRILHE